MFRKILVAFLLTLLTSTTFAQFGRNKVQYTEFDWSVITTPHFEIYYYEEEVCVANIAADFAEGSFKFLAEKYDHEPTGKITLIIYSNPSHFRQTNTIPQLLPEGVGGFTEFMKGRVVLPFNGSLTDFQHVIQHELVHAFMSDLLITLKKESKKRNAQRPPLWFEEGLAEYWAEGWTTRANSIVREMVLSENIITFPNLYKIRGTFLMYKVGQNIIKFLNETYGEEKFTELLHSLSTNTKFTKTIEKVYGDTFYEIGNKWVNSLKKDYYREYENKEFPSTFAKYLTRKGVNVEPVVTDNNEIVHKSVGRGYVELKIDNKTIIKDGRNGEYESLHFFNSSIGTLDDFLVFSVKSGETDQLCIYQISTGKMLFKHAFSSIVSIKSPTISADGVAFSGTKKDGFSDLYYFEFTTCNLYQLTNDIYLDEDPVISRVYNYIAFSSDRAGSYKNTNIFIYDLNTNKIHRVTNGDYNDKFPAWGCTDDKLIFTSDRNSTQNIYLIPHVHKAKIEIHQITNSVSDVMHPCFTSNDSSIVFSGYEKFSYQLFKCKLPDTIYTTMFDTITQNYDSWLYNILIREPEEYKKKFSLDFAQSSFAYDTYYGGTGGLQLALSDQLGDSYFYFLLFNTAENSSNFFKGLNFAAVRYDKKTRWNKGLGIFRFSNYYHNKLYGPLEQQNYGLFGSLEYPFSQFTRVEFTTQLRHTKKTTLTNFNTNAFVHDLSISYVKDNSIWVYTGPIEGQRFRAAIKFSYDMINAKQWTTTGMLDFRNYWRLGERSTFATRCVGFKSIGLDPDRIYMGGSWDVKGYPFMGFYGKNAVLLSNELRFPLIDNIAFDIGPVRFGFPQIETALSIDIGKAWEKEMNPMLGSYGFGVRVPLGGAFIFRFDFVKRFNLSDKKMIDNGFKFKFFFGQNF